MRNLNDKIPGAPDFRYREFVKSNEALRFGINNIPDSEEIWRNIEALAINVLQPIRNKFGRINISSGYRSPILNPKVGGSPNSNHCKGEAADIEPYDENIKLIDIVNYVYLNLDWRWMICEYFPSGWVHIDFRKSSNIKMIKLKDETHNYVVMPIEDINAIYLPKGN